jgi:hypothetical protein
MSARPKVIRLAAVAAALLVAVTLPALAEKPAAPAPAGKEPGELWENTVQMTGMGMAMPPQTSKVCRPKSGWNEPPMAADKNHECEMLDVKSSPGKMSWSMRCKGNPPTTGTGEITFDGQDTFKGTVTMKTAEGEMLMKLSGRNLHQDCDAGELKRQVVATKQASQDAMAKACVDGARSMTLMLFDGPSAMCKEPAQKAEFCKNLATMKGFGSLPADPSSPNSSAAAAKFCDTTPQALLADLCPKALAQDSFEFLGKNCPTETKALAERECAGRKYTALSGSKYQGFCATFAADMLAGAQKDESKPAEADPKASAVDKAKKKIRGLFGK